MSTKRISIGKFQIGGDLPIAVIAGPCVIESRESALQHATELKEKADRVGVPYIFKSSYDKANRSSVGSFRGPGLKKGLEILAEVKKQVGVPIALGSDCGMPSRFPNGRNALEFILYARNGMPNEQVLVAGTSSSAKLLGVDAIVGSIEPGKWADLVVLDGNPLDDMQAVLDRVCLVMKGGAIVRNDHADLGGRTDVDYHRTVTAAGPA